MNMGMRALHPSCILSKYPTTYVKCRRADASRNNHQINWQKKKLLRDKPQSQFLQKNLHFSSNQRDRV